MNITEIQAKTDAELADLAKEMGILEDGVVPRRQDLINRVILNGQIMKMRFYLVLMVL